MQEILSGLRVLDLSWGIAGPLTGMLLCDHGADVIRIEPPGGDPMADIGRCKLGYKTWQRGKRSIELDLKNPEDLDVFMTLAAHADILVEGFSIGVTERLGIDYETLREINPRLIYASIDGYRDTSHRERPTYDLLVSARMGLQWEHRSWPETSIYRMSKAPDPYPDFEVDRNSQQGPPRDGPIVAGVPTASLGAFYTAMTTICAALYVREDTGRGQHIQTSMMQGSIFATQAVWQRAEHYDKPGFATWIYGQKAPKGHFKCADGRWIHNWVPNPRFMLNAAEGDTLNSSPDFSLHDDPDRLGTGAEETFVVTYYNEQIAEKVVKFDSAEWVKAGAIADIPLQLVRTPEEGLTDPVYMDYGAVREVEDPELGTIRQAGRFIEFQSTPTEPRGIAPFPNQHGEEIRAEAARLAAAGNPTVPATATAPAPAAPLDGVRVVDFGLAVAGPYGTQMLGDLGADVIKVNAFHDAYWLRNHIAFTCNRSKRSLCVDLKNPKGYEVIRSLIGTTDAVQHNMRYEATKRLGVDYESLKAIKPDLIYCHTMGFVPGPRENLPGNEQTGACLAGVEYEDGGIANGGRPIWNMTMFGDTGTGLLSAIGILNALYHRKRTGEGQFLRTSIVNAQLLTASHILARPDGSGIDRPRIDGMQQGFSALYGLYRTADRWLALAALTEAEWNKLKAALPQASLDDDRFASPELRTANDADLRARLEGILREKSAADWFTMLDGAGVPCEISDETMGQRVHDDPEIAKLGLTARFDHPFAGKFDQVGLAYEMSETPGRIEHGPIVLGNGTTDLLGELGYSNSEIEKLADDNVIGTWSPGEPLPEGPRHVMGASKAAKQAAKAE
ncbi:MAG: CoA transferase [Sphingomonadaceae bacterium]|nr:CoA transferase [Sphingomonadaceae bacterium]